MPELCCIADDLRRFDRFNSDNPFVILLGLPDMQESTPTGHTCLDSIPVNSVHSLVQHLLTGSCLMLGHIDPDFHFRNCCYFTLKKIDFAGDLVHQN